MAGKLKVYGGCFNGTARWIVAAPSKRAAAEAFDINIHVMNAYASETGNPDELALALAEPGQVFTASSSEHYRRYVRGRHSANRSQPWPPQ